MKPSYVALGVALVAGVIAAVQAWLRHTSPAAATDALQPTHVAPQVSDGSDQGVYQTHPDDAELDPSGWVLTSAGLVTALPLRDRTTGLFARLTYAAAQIVAARLGATLLTADQQDAVAREGLVLDPVILPPTSSMRSLAWARHEDAGITSQLAAKPRGAQAVSNVGKDWIDGAPPGKARNRGWYVVPGTVRGAAPPSGVPIQPDAMAHADVYGDYSQLTRLRRPAEAA